MSIRALPALELDPRGVPLVGFCGHCGRAPAPADPGTVASRVCGHCGLGLVLHASCDLAPTPDDAFLVIDSTLSVCAVSARAEKLLGTDETEAVNRHIADFLVPADANAPSAANLLALLVDAASGPGEPRTAVVRPRQEFGIRFRARVGACGPPHAALLVLAD
jgi:PAS domain-containing protein